ncbi:uncharacterized protein LOC119706335 isoform X1 [Motacilla alba alba]|uniref:uncharacterized protein LOC119706335 isoform X1 n=1 Tax=Motacilla alba alba TaxID=1094192 RepID=UPI0018D5037A|nr:uncharacterized protein LOC119706335 isoform X1 [Motacilla alba alba]
MRDQINLLATVTVLGVLEQAYFAMQVIYARRKYKVSPPETTGHPEFERTFRAQANCSEYFPIFISLLWVAGIFFHQAGSTEKGLNSSWEQLSPLLPGGGSTGSPCSFAGAWLSPLCCFCWTRCGCSVWAAVPLQPPPVLPGLRRGCPGTVGTAVCQCLAALGAAGAGSGWAPGTLPEAQLLHMDGSTAVASPAPWCLVRGATAPPKPTVCPLHRGASHVAPSEREYFPGSAFPAEGRWMLALLCSSEIISLLESKCFPASAPAEELHCWAL